MTTRTGTRYSSNKGKDYYRIEVQHGSKKFVITPFSVMRENGKRVSMANASQSLIEKANKIRQEVNVVFKCSNEILLVELDHFRRNLLSRTKKNRRLRNRTRMVDIS